MEATAVTGWKNRFRIREKLLRIKAQPRKVSLGYALGVFLGTTPFIGLKVFIALICTHLFRWNKVAAVIGVYHINILTAPLFYGAAFIVGKWILGSGIDFILPSTLSFSAMYSAFTASRMIFFCFLAGGFALGVPMAFAAYWFSMLLLKNQKGGITGHREKDAGSVSPYPASWIKLLSPPVYTLITGASTGLGKEMAIECAGRGMNVILVALPGRNLDVFCDELEKEYGIRAMHYEKDLTRKVEVLKLAEDILSRFRVNFLINNAGMGGTVPFESSSVDYIERIIQLNITAVSLLTRLMIPELRKHPQAWILNVSSMAAFSPFPFKTVYPASKAFVASFSRGLGEELKGTSVKVGVLHPGPILTNPDVSMRIIRQGQKGKRGLLPAKELARRAIDQVKKGRRTIVPGLANKVNRLLMTVLPGKIVLPVLSKAISKEIIFQEQFAA